MPRPFEGDVGPLLARVIRRFARNLPGSTGRHAANRRSISRDDPSAPKRAISVAKHGAAPERHEDGVDLAVGGVA